MDGEKVEKKKVKFKVKVFVKKKKKYVFFVVFRDNFKQRFLFFGIERKEN